MNPINNAISPVGPGAVGQGAANSPFMAGALSQMGDLDGFLKGKQSPEAAQLLQMMQQLIQMLIQLIQNGQTPGQEGGGAPAGGAPAGGGSAGGGSAGGAPKGGSAAGTEKVDGPNGFLWKPVSESNGKLVTLLPPNLKGKVAGVEIQDASGRVLDRGKFSGDQKNGGRPHYRFGKAGAAYGDNVKVVVRLKNGETTSFPIKRGAARND